MSPEVTNIVKYCPVGNFILWNWSMALMHDYIRRAHFTAKPHFTAKFFVAPCKEIRIPESGKFLHVEIFACGIWNPGS